MVRFAKLFLFYPQLCFKWSLPTKKWAKSDKNGRFGDQNKVRLSKKVKPHRARILFWKSLKTCPKWFAMPNFFDIIPNYGLSGICLQKWAKSDENWQRWLKQSLVFEKVKPHRARILFWKSVKTCSKRFALSNFFWPQLWLKWSLPAKNETNRTKIDDLVTKTKVGGQKS